VLLAQGRIWRATLGKGAQAVVVSCQRDGLDDELGELRDLRFEVPVARWNGVVKHVVSDRKLLGGMLLDWASQKDLVAAVVANDRALCELQRVVLDATTALVESGRLVLRPAADENE
jgi:hypothetical protein